MISGRSPRVAGRMWLGAVMAVSVYPRDDGRALLEADAQTPDVVPLDVQQEVGRVGDGEHQAEVADDGRELRVSCTLIFSTHPGTRLSGVNGSPR